MEEQDVTAGYGIHYCADYHDRAFRTAPDAATHRDTHRKAEG